MRMDLTRAGGIAILGMVVGIAPLAVGVAYALRPSERRLALMRPLSLATIFAALCTLLAGLAATLRGIAAAGSWAAVSMPGVMHSLSESITPMFVAFGLLTVSWIAAAVGMRRQ